MQYCAAQMQTHPRTYVVRTYKQTNKYWIIALWIDVIKCVVHSTRHPTNPTTSECMRGTAEWTRRQAEQKRKRYYSLPLPNECVCVCPNNAWLHGQRSAANHDMVRAYLAGSNAAYLWNTIAEHILFIHLALNASTFHCWPFVCADFSAQPLRNNFEIPSLGVCTMWTS